MAFRIMGGAGEGVKENQTRVQTLQHLESTERLAKLCVLRRGVREGGAKNCRNCLKNTLKIVVDV
jgi:hypothetical protein